MGKYDQTIAVYREQLRATIQDDLYRRRAKVRQWFDEAEVTLSQAIRSRRNRGLFRRIIADLSKRQ